VSLEESNVAPVQESRAKYVLKKQKQIEDLRGQSKVAGGVGQSLRSLAPVVRGELRSVVGLLLRSGKLAADWQNALEAAKGSEVPDDEKTISAVAVLLTNFADEAGKRVLTHGDMLLDRRSELTGKADGIEEMLKELHEKVAPEDSEDGTGNETPPPDSDDEAGA